MYGAIIGDIAGSYYEVLEINAKRNKTMRSSNERKLILENTTPLFTDMSSVTDDSILTCAILDAILTNSSYEEKLKEYGLKEISTGLDKYGRNKFGSGFIKWLKGDTKGTSFGNGCAMRIAPIGFLFNNIETIKEESFKATIPSHNHPESLKCSEAVAVSIFLLRLGYTKEELKKYIENNYFSLNFDLEDLRANYEFTSRAINSVPQAIYAFLKSSNFEDAIRIAISIGGDSDTIACITGALAEIYYNIPDNLIKQSKNYIPEYMQKVINQYYYETKKTKGLIKKYEKNSRQTN